MLAAETPPDSAADMRLAGSPSGTALTIE